jgi:hypothetical protein
MFSMERRRAYSCVPPAMALILDVAKFDAFRFLPSALPSRLAFP